MTLWQLASENKGVHFNSHAHVERDVVLSDDMTILCDFNSHAHVERDSVGLIGKLSAENFNSHAHVERDVNDN